MFKNIGIMQGRLVPSEKKNRLQYFPIKNWKKEMKLMNKNNIKILEWTINIEKINQNPLLDINKIDEILKVANFNKIKIPSVTCDFFMEKPFFKNPKNKIALKILRKIIENGKKIGIKYFILPLVDNSSIKNINEEKYFLKEIKKFDKFLNNDQMILFEIDFKPKKVKKFISKFNKKFGINYDSGNSASQGYDFNDEKKYFNKVYNIHLKDRLYKGQSVPLGEGDCKFKNLFQFLKKIKYKNNLILQTARSKYMHVNEIKKNKMYIDKYL